LDLGAEEMREFRRERECGMRDCEGEDQSAEMRKRQKLFVNKISLVSHERKEEDFSPADYTPSKTSS